MPNNSCLYCEFCGGESCYNGSSGLLDCQLFVVQLFQCSLFCLLSHEESDKSHCLFCLHIETEISQSLYLHMTNAVIAVFLLVNTGARVFTTTPRRFMYLFFILWIFNKLLYPTICTLSLLGSSVFMKLSK